MRTSASTGDLTELLVGDLRRDQLFIMGTAQPPPSDRLRPYTFLYPASASPLPTVLLCLAVPAFCGRPPYGCTCPIRADVSCVCAYFAKYAITPPTRLVLSCPAVDGSGCNKYVW